MGNKVPETVEQEFTKALDRHEQDLRKGLTKHLDHIEKHHVNQDTVHHIDATSDSDSKEPKKKPS
jgi:hypothetical protein